MEITLETFDELMLKLKAAGVTRASFHPDGGLAGVEFAPEPVDTRETLSAPSTPARRQLTPEEQETLRLRPGYSALFGNGTPRFDAPRKPE